MHKLMNTKSPTINDLSPLFDVDCLHFAVQLSIMKKKRLDSNAFSRQGQSWVGPFRVKTNISNKLNSESKGVMEKEFSTNTILHSPSILISKLQPSSHNKFSV